MEEAESKKKWPFWFKVYEQSWSCTQEFISEVKPIFEKHGIQFNSGRR
jgi:hypothetical protein